MSKTEKEMNYLQELKNMFSADETVMFREFSCMKNPAISFCIAFVDGMSNKDVINSQIVKPIIEAKLETALGINQLLDAISKEVITAASLSSTGSMDDILKALMSGSTILFVDGFNTVIVINTADIEKRTITEPESEKIIAGPREGFIEDIGTNIALIRKRLKTKDLKLKFKEIGTVTETKVCICYLDNVADKKLIKEVEERLKKIDIDSILDIGYIKEMIKDTPATPFKTVGETERPDVAVGKLLEGRVVIICDGSPMAVTIPFLFIEYFNVNEDYYTNYYYATINRMIRWIGFFLASSVPAIYVALVTFHQEMIPTQLLLSISGSRQNVPFPTIVEALLMLFIFELLRETSVRIPSVVGQTISIVGALVIGQAAVDAKLVSAPMIIVAAMTGITSFATPKMQGELIIIRLIFIVAASIIGLYGYIFCVIGMFIHLASLRSFGVPYMLNIASVRPGDEKDVAVRAPWKTMKTRPELIAQENMDRSVNDEEAGDEVEKG
jgi:spore germination protein KA